MTDFTESDMGRFAAKLRNWPANGRPDLDDDVVVLQALGLVVKQQQETACKACGTPRVDFTWLKITPAGYLFMSAWQSGREEPFVNEAKAAAAAEQMELHEQTKAVARAEGHIPAVGDLDSPVPNRFDHTKRGFQP